ncbi:MAG: hypothetical protein ACWGQW_04590 [bacterium]
MDWLWGCCGKALFDVYSLNHFGWFIALTLMIYPILRRHTIFGVAAIMVFWELVEVVIAKYSTFPLAGHEDWRNKIVGDPISNLMGFLLAMAIIKHIEKEKMNGQR